MLSKSDRIEALVALGKALGAQTDLDEIFERARQRNGFFIPVFCQSALKAVLPWFERENLEAWLKNVPDIQSEKRVGLVLAGNIPLVGLHDLISVFAVGHRAVFKPSSLDETLIDWVFKVLYTVCPASAFYFEKADRLNKVDAIMATGSSASMAHFSYYFKHIPGLFRGSKSSLAVLYGFESEKELAGLADDIMLYFGLGCRNVTKLLVPEQYDFTPFFEALERYRYLTDVHKYQNNLIYHQAIFLMNSDAFLENGILLLKPGASVFSPVGVLHFETYKNLDEAKDKVEAHRKDLQCVVSYQGQLPHSIPFGQAQFPGLTDYADGANTLDFLICL